MNRHPLFRSLSVIMFTLAASSMIVGAAHASAHARVGAGHKVDVHTWAGNYNNRCDGTDPNHAVCVSVSLSPVGFSYASAWASRYFGLTTAYKIGRASAGLYKGLPQTEAVYSRDSVAVTMVSPALGQTNFGLSGRVTARKDAVNGGLSKLFLTVYPSEAAANNGSGSVAAGYALLDASKGVTFSGLFKASDFVVTSNLPDSISIVPVANLTYAVSVPDTGAVAAQMDLHEEVTSVPGHSTQTLLALMALLGLGGVWMLRSRKSSSVA